MGRCKKAARCEPAKMCRHSSLSTSSAFHEAVGPKLDDETCLLPEVGALGVGVYSEPSLPQMPGTEHRSLEQGEISCLIHLLPGLWLPEKLEL